MTSEEAERVAQERIAAGDFAGAGAAREGCGLFFEAALAFERAGDPWRALENLMRVTTGAPRYRDACLHAIGLAADHGPLSLGFENLVAEFVRSGPANAVETEGFLELARLYERDGLVENAVEALRQVTKMAPGHTSAEEALRRLGGSRPLPELPDLPELPEPGAQAPRLEPAAAALSDSEEHPFHVGATIGGRYRLEQRIGSGGMSVVFRATDLQLGDQVAVKVFLRAVFDPETDARLRRELSLSRLLVHPNVVRLYALGQAFGLRYVTLELLDGVELASRMRDEPLPLGEGLDYLIQACAGLQAAHDLGIVHRDVKPANLFVLRQGELKVMDFGIAKLRDASGLTATGMVAGTPAYMAPEQVLDFRSVSGAADQYSLGIVAFEMFTATKPFSHPDPVPLMLLHTSAPVPKPRSRNPALAPELEELILRALQKEPARRFGSCREMSWHLERLRQRR